MAGDPPILKPETPVTDAEKDFVAGKYYYGSRSGGEGQPDLPCYSGYLRGAIATRDRHFAETILQHAETNGVKFGEGEEQSLALSINEQMGHEVIYPKALRQPQPVITTEMILNEKDLSAVDFGFYKDFAEAHGVKFDLQEQLQQMLERFVGSAMYLCRLAEDGRGARRIDRLLVLAKRNDIELDFKSPRIQEAMQAEVRRLFRSQVEELDSTGVANPDVIRANPDETGETLEKTMGVVVAFAREYGVPLNIASAFSEALGLLQARESANPGDSDLIKRVENKKSIIRKVLRNCGVGFEGGAK